MSLDHDSSVGLWLLIVALASVGQLSFKAAAARTADHSGLSGLLRMTRRPSLWVGVACFLLHFVLWIAFLSHTALSKGMLLVSLEIVVIYVAGQWLFKEPHSWLQLVGVTLISAGVAVVALFP